MKDAKGHGSNPRGAHAAGVEKVGIIQPGVWYHGSPLGEPGIGPVHVGTAQAAKEALEARIGIPADGKGWNGDREYGKTLIAGTDTLHKLAAQGYHYGLPESGYNVDVPKNDYYPGDRTDERATMGFVSKPLDGYVGERQVPVPLDAKPAVRAYEIHGNMSNSANYPTTDRRANAMANRLKNQGVYYKNEGEDFGSISAVVPSKSYLWRKQV